VSTHEVTNQPPPLEYNAFRSDAALRDAVAVFGGDPDDQNLLGLGAFAGSATANDWGRLANEYTPVLRTFNRYGQRVDEVEYHPTWHELMNLSVSHGLHAAPWVSDDKAAHVRRAAGFLTVSQAEAGHGCPISMTYAAIPALRVDPELAAQWEPGLTSTEYDFGLRNPAEKRGLIAGMSMTEKQGGSDVRTNTTVTPRGEGTYWLRGHKWFCSAPMSDLFLVLAQAPGGLTCFVVPRVLPDGSRNVFEMQRLKNKLGNHSNASSEIELREAAAWMIGPEGRGVPTIIEMVMMTRFDCIVGSASLMRQALAQALHHCTQREVSGRRLADHALMRNVLADLALESEAALLLAMRVARRLDEAAHDARARQFVRVATAVGKYWVCKRAPAHVNEAAECLGGAGYVEESILPRLYREAPVNSTWEGSGNVQCVDVLRALGREPGALEAFVDELAPGAARDRRLAAFTARLQADLAHGENREHRARELVGRMAVALQAALLLEAGHAALAEAFCATRLAGRGMVYGELPPGLDCATIIERARPQPA